MKPQKCICGHKGIAHVTLMNLKETHQLECIICSCEKFEVDSQTKGTNAVTASDTFSSIIAEYQESYDSVCECNCPLKLQKLVEDACLKVRDGLVNAISPFEDGVQYGLIKLKKELGISNE